MDDQARLIAIESKIAEIDSDMDGFKTILSSVYRHQQTQMLQEADEVPQKGGVMRDTVWCCDNCAMRLGIYNPEKDELRVKYKDFVMYITPGVGGKTSIPCRRCGLINTLEDTRQAAKQVVK